MPLKCCLLYDITSLLVAIQAAMVEAVFVVAPKVLPDASFQNIANLAYGLAILSHRAPPELLTAVAEAALLRMPSASSHVRFPLLDTTTPP